MDGPDKLDKLDKRDACGDSLSKMSNTSKMSDGGAGLDKDGLFGEG